MNRYLDGDPTEVNQWGVCPKCRTRLRRIWTVAGWSAWFHLTIEQGWLCEPATRYGVSGERRERERRAYQQEPGRSGGLAART